MIHIILFGFALSTRFVNSLNISCLYRIQSKEKLKPLVTRSPRNFFGAVCRLRVFGLSFAWFTGLSVSFVIGKSNHFGFGYSTLR